MLLIPGTYMEAKFSRLAFSDRGSAVSYGSIRCTSDVTGLVYSGQQNILFSPVFLIIVLLSLLTGKLLLW